MSGITIHTSEGSVATVPGSQRALASLTAIQITMRVLGATSPRRIFDLIQDGTLPPEAIDAIAIGESHVDAVRMWLGDFLGLQEVTIAGESTPVTHAVLNTAAVQGSDAEAFLARLHGSIESCIWVQNTDLPWFAALLRDVAALTGEDAWAKAADAISTATSPVVISSSQGADFPGYIYDDDDGEDVDDLPWADALARVQEHGWWLQITPDNLHQPAYTPLLAFPLRSAELRAEAIIVTQDARDFGDEIYRSPIKGQIRFAGEERPSGS